MSSTVMGIKLDAVVQAHSWAGPEGHKSGSGCAAEEARELAKAALAVDEQPFGAIGDAHEHCDDGRALDEGA